MEILDRFEEKYELPRLDFFKHQLYELESIYPYNIFASIGAVFKSVKCTICGREISDRRCSHIVGQLYNGKIAQRNLGDIVLNHVSLVSDPYDKRCIAKIENLDLVDYYKCIEYYSLNSIDSLQVTKTSTITKYEKEVMKRNESCLCGSGKKYKKCCGSPDKLKYNHMHIEVQKIYRFEDFDFM